MALSGSYVRLLLQSDQKAYDQYVLWFPRHICGVKPTVSEASQFNAHVCDTQATHTLHACAAMHCYRGTDVSLRHGRLSSARV